MHSDSLFLVYISDVNEDAMEDALELNSFGSFATSEFLKPKVLRDGGAATKARLLCTVEC